MKWACVLLLSGLLLWLFVHRTMVLLCTCDSGDQKCDLKTGPSWHFWEDDGAAEEGSTMHVPVESQQKSAKTSSDIPYDINSGFDSDDEDSQEHDCHPFDIKYDKSCVRGSSDQIKDSVGRCLSSDLKGRLRHLTAHPSVVPSWARWNVVGAVPLFTVNELSRALLYLALLARLFALTTSQGTQPVSECPGISVGAARPRKGRRSGSNTTEEHCNQQAQQTSECVPGQPRSSRQANTVVDKSGQVQSTRVCVPRRPCSSNLVVASSLPNNAGLIRAVGGTRPRDDNETQGAENARIKEREDTKRLMEENERLRERMYCTLCKTKLRTIVFLPCGHMIYCGDCADKVSRCPVCRTNINGKQLTRLPDHSL